MLKDLENELKQLKNSVKGIFLQRFFKTGPGQYGEGDIFIGLTVPQSRTLAKKYCSLSFKEIEKLFTSPIHEKRIIALLILVNNFQKGTEIKKKIIFNFYLKSIRYINNWDLVDLSADKIIGVYLENKERAILYELANSDNIWKKRIAMISTYHFIKNNQFKDTFSVAEILLQDTHDLIHKAVGWMLREVGKRDQKQEESFLKKHYKKMPRTMLRYAIERFDERKRQMYLKGSI